MLDFVENKNGFDLIQDGKFTGQAILVEKLFDEDNEILVPAIYISNSSLQLPYLYSIDKEYVIKDVDIILKYLNIQISQEQFNKIVEKLYSLLLKLKPNNE